MADAPPQQVLMVSEQPQQPSVGVEAAAADDAPKEEEEKQEVVIVEGGSGGGGAADILQQAFQEATEFEPANVEYDNVENAVAEVHGEQTEEEEEEEAEGGETEEVVIAETTPVVAEEEEEEEQEEEQQEETPQTTITQEVVDETVLQEVEEVDAAEEEEDSDVTVLPNPAVKSTVRLLSAVAHPKATKVNAQAPIGSSQNPIQIIQQGNTYHSTQVLSQEQLQQIAQVLQQQQQLSQLNPNGGTSVLYNAATNTRIVYRIIYPSEVQNKTSATTKPSTPQTPVPIQPKSPLGSSSGRGRGRPRKPWGKRHEEPEDRAESPDLSREEKEEKKKHRPRTRSGRISKPPKYMMKDYKRIHHLDFDEDPYDDSDGGYSDYRVSNDDDDENSRSSTSSFTGGSLKRRNRCRTCNKVYVGRGGLARHYRMNPTHGSHDDAETDVNGTGPDTPASVIEGQPSNDGPLISPKPSPTMQTGTSVTGPPRRRGRPANHELAALRRKAKLKEIVKACDTEDLMETVLPTLAKAVDVWEFMLMKCERGEPAKPDVASVCKELDVLLKHAQKMAQDFLSAIPEAQVQKTGGEYLQISDSRLAEAMGITMGLYQIKNEKSFRYKVVGTDSKEVLRKRRTIQVVASDQMVLAQPPNKRPRLEVSVAQAETRGDAGGADPGSQFIQSQPMVLDFEGVTKKLNVQEVVTVSAESDDVVSTTTETTMVTNSIEASETTVQSTEPEIMEIKVDEGEAVSQTVVSGEDSATDADATATYAEAETLVEVAPSEIEADDKTVQLITGEGETSETVSIVQSQVMDQMQLVCAENEVTTTEGGEAIIRIAENGTPQFITPEGHVLMQDADGQPILGQVICQSTEDGEVIRQVVIQDGQILTSGQLEGVTDLSELSQTILPSNVVILQNPDGTATALQLPEGENSLPLETVQALFAMDPETRAQILNSQTTELTE